MHNKQPFTLATHNWIFFGVVACVAFLVNYLSTDRSYYGSIEAMGAATFTILLPLFFAWLTWLLKGKKKNAGQTTFNFVILLVLLSQFSSCNRRIEEQNQQLDQLEKSRDEFLDEMKGDQEKSTSSLNDFESSFDQYFLYKIEKSTGEERKVNKAMYAFNKELFGLTNNFYQAVDSIDSDNFLNYNHLKINKNYNEQRDIAYNYINQTNLYKQFISNKDSVINFQFNKNNVDKNSKIAKEAKSAAKNAIKKNEDLMQSSLKAHLSFGKKSIQLLDFLEANQNDWIYENDEIIFKSVKKETLFLSITDSLDKYQNIIYQNSNETINN